MKQLQGSITFWKLVTHYSVQWKTIPSKMKLFFFLVLFSSLLKKYSYIVSMVLYQDHILTIIF